MEIDEITEKRIEKYLDRIWNDVLNHPEPKVQHLAGGVYQGALKMLNILGVEIINRNKFK